MKDHSWSESYTDFKVQTLSYLNEHGKEIGQKSKEGNQICKRIISNYALLYKSFDTLTHEMLKIDLYQYLEDRKNL